MKLSEAFKKADDVLATAARGIAEIITVPGYVNVDFEDVKTVMKDSGKAIMGSGTAEGENRAEKAIKDAIHSPLLNDSNIEGAKNILLYITSGTNEVSLDEVDEILEIAQNACGNNSDVIWGNGTDESLGEALSVTLIATGFNHDARPYNTVINEKQASTQPRKVYDLNGEVKNEAKEAPVAPAGAAVGTIAATEVESVITKEEKPEVKPEVKPEEKTVHNLFSFEEPIVETSEVVEETPEAKEEAPTIEDDEPLFEPTVEATPIAPSQDTQPVTHYEDERPVVRVFDNPFRSSGGDDEGFEISSRFITREEVETKAEQEVAVIEAKKIKTIDPKEELKKQRLRALSMNFRTAKGLEELENQPAYLRRNVDINHTDDNDLSNYSTSKNGISGENSYLHGNVD